MTHAGNWRCRRRGEARPTGRVSPKTLSPDGLCQRSHHADFSAGRDSPSLRQGARVGVFTPSWPAHLMFAEKYQHGLAALQDLGFEVVEGETTRARIARAIERPRLRIGRTIHATHPRS